MNIWFKKNKYKKEKELLNEKNKKLMEEIEKLRKENEKYMLQLEEETTRFEISKKENNDLVNKNRIVENEIVKYKNLNNTLNNQLNQKTNEVRLYIIIIE